MRELLGNWGCTALDTGSPLRSGMAFHSYNKESYGLAGSDFKRQGHSAVMDIAGLRQDEQTSMAELDITVDGTEGKNGSGDGR
jgi:hypothetical protein